MELRHGEVVIVPAARARSCEYCNSAKGDPCRTKSGKIALIAHTQRCVTALEKSLPYQKGWEADGSLPRWTGNMKKTERITVGLLIPVSVQMYVSYDDNGEIDISGAQVSEPIPAGKIRESLDEEGWEQLEEKVAEALGPFVDPDEDNGDE